MNTNMKELNLSEMELVNGGEVVTAVAVAVAAVVVTVATGVVKVADFIYDCVMGH